jgi:hypothetical protein
MNRGTVEMGREADLWLPVRISEANLTGSGWRNTCQGSNRTSLRNRRLTLHTVSLRSCSLFLSTFNDVIKSANVIYCLNKHNRMIVNSKEGGSCRGVTRRPGFETGSVHVGFMVDKRSLRQVFLWVLRFSLSISFHRGSPYSYITWGMNNRPVKPQFRDIVSPHRHEREHEGRWNRQWYIITHCTTI